MTELKTTPKPSGLPPLGIYTKSSSPPLRDPHRTARAERFTLLATARHLLLTQGAQQGLEHPNRIHRTSKCAFIARQPGIGVLTARVDSGQAAFYGGLVMCGSVWSCPVCAAKVQERRREEIARGVAWAHEQGLQCAMVTLTFPHQSWQSLEDLRARQSKALAAMRSGKAWAQLMAALGFMGLIRSLELTRGQHGWHPHTHELWLVRPDVDAQELRDIVSRRWSSACARVGLLDRSSASQLRAFEARAVDVRGHCSASDYLAKQDDSRHWGVDHELAKGTSKRANGGAKGVHPFGLLARAADGDRAAGALYLEYAHAMKGARQIFWSPGLKGRVQLDEVDDEELAQEAREEAALLGLLDYHDWRTVREARAQAAVLDAAERAGWPGVRALVDQLIQAEIERLEELLEVIRRDDFQHAMRNERSGLSEAKPRSESGDACGVHCVAKVSV